MEGGGISKFKVRKNEMRRGMISENLAFINKIFLRVWRTLLSETMYLCEE